MDYPVSKKEINGEPIMPSLITAIIGVGTTFLRGYVLSIMWGWFIVAKFPSMPSLGVLEAIGINFVVGLFTMHSLSFSDHLSINNTNKEQLANYHLNNVLTMLIITLVTWLCAWFIHLCM